MPRGVYERKQTKKTKAKKNSLPKLEMNINEIIGDQSAPANFNLLMKSRTELDTLGDILGDFESLPEEAKYRVMAYFVNKYHAYAPS